MAYIIQLDDNTQQVCLDIVYMCPAPSYKDLSLLQEPAPGPELADGWQDLGRRHLPRVRPHHLPPLLGVHAAAQQCHVNKCWQKYKLKYMLSFLTPFIELCKDV